MGASTLLETTELSIMPGSEATATLRIRNTGTVVDQFTFQPLGAAAPWMVIDPPQVSLLPGAEETVRVTFHPPRVSSTLAGTTPWAVRALSREDPEGSVVDEGAITVEPFDEREVELTPRTARGRRASRHELAFDNKGNAQCNIRLSGVDPENALECRFNPAGVSAAPGTAHFVKVRVQPRQTFWKGPPKTHPFQLVVEEEGKDLLAVDGVMLQEPLLPPWFWKAVLLAAVLLLLLFILWQTLFKSTIESAASDAVADDVEQAELAAVKAEEAAAVAQDAAGITTTVAGDEGSGEEAGAGDEGSGEEGDEGGPGGSTTTSPGGVDDGGSGLQTALGTPLDFRLVASAAPAAPAGTANFPIEADREFSLTDVLLQNPNGDAGRLAIMRDDQILYESALENFRDLDFHFVSPYEFAPGDRVVLQVTCDVAGKGATCSAAASFAGFVRPSS